MDAIVILIVNNSYKVLHPSNPPGPHPIHLFFPIADL